MAQLAVITGGGGGMGLSVARIMGRDHSVLISDVDEDRLKSASRQLSDDGIDCTTATCDITDPASVRQLIARAQQLGTIRSLVHTAGVSPSMGSAELIVRINAVGTVVVNDAFFDIAEPGMALVNVASVAGHQLPKMLAPQRSYRVAMAGDVERLHSRLVSICNRFPAKRRPQLAYVLSKNFVIWYSKAISAKFGGKGTRVVSISPGSFDTPMGKLEENAGAGALAQLGALKRLGHPTEIAELIAFVASDKPGYLTGTDIICDGGVMATMTLFDTLKLGRSN
ncbi:SDR family oxidoreductase [Mycolicibacterium iranicum]|uniref:SDR family oxidoreductase n=1 Tax=Mycolicibacterium iranicum TaxID=912594 RepID=A0ABT4HKJ5_MYCIR|nr:SDR family oxidoreductase [Mycolicibacterium iranicum]MCZ0730719.1 SDR family oxidoreductase [Mycolicibacterium iranicum]